MQSEIKNVKEEEMEERVKLCKNLGCPININGACGAEEIKRRGTWRQLLLKDQRKNIERLGLENLKKQIHELVL